jgi:hypothetical protein
MIDIADAFIESSNATEARSESDLHHWQFRLIDEFLREVQTNRLSHRAGARSKVAHEQAAKVTRGYTETLSQNFHAALIQAVFCNQAQGS